MNESASERHFSWRGVGNVGDMFACGPQTAVTIDDVQIALFLVEDEVYAIDDLCTHGIAYLSEGLLEGFEIECPLHGGVFDIRTGKAICDPATCDVRRHTTRCEGGSVLVQLPSESAGSNA